MTGRWIEKYVLHFITSEVTHMHTSNARTISPGSSASRTQPASTEKELFVLMASHRVLGTVTPSAIGSRSGRASSRRIVVSWWCLLACSQSATAMTVVMVPPPTPAAAAGTGRRLPSCPFLPVDWVTVCVCVVERMRTRIDNWQMASSSVDLNRRL